MASSNLNRVADEAGSYRAEPKRPPALSKEEQQLLEKYRRLKPSQRTQARAIVTALASTDGGAAKGQGSGKHRGKR